jgi:hypothetical protein
MVHPRQQRRRRPRQAADAEQRAVLLGAIDQGAGAVELPVAQAGDLLGVDEGLAALEELLEGHRRAQRVADAVRQQRHVEGLGDEVGGAAEIGFVDGFLVVEGGQHHDRQVLEARVGAQPAAGFVAAHAGHDHVEQDHLRHEAVGQHLQRHLGRFCGLDDETLRRQHRLGDHAGDGLVIDDEDADFIHGQPLRGT